MDGPEHYQNGDISYAKAQKAGATADGAAAVLHLQAAQFHATMALAAAVGQLVQMHRQVSPGIRSAWGKAFAGEMKLEE